MWEQVGVQPAQHAVAGLVRQPLFGQVQAADFGGVHAVQAERDASDRPARPWDGQQDLERVAVVHADHARLRVDPLQPELGGVCQRVVDPLDRHVLGGSK